MVNEEKQAKISPETTEKVEPKEAPKQGTTKVEGKIDVTTALKPGATVRVHQKIKDVNAKGEEKERIQIFEGIIIARHKKKEYGATVTIRKISNGVGVEKIFPINLPTITKWEVVKQSKVRRAKLYFLRDYKKRLKEIKA
jgi:large subunit ribosomal protein L19